jgi:plasmid rolling circle replication initiator protein Rep
LTIPNVPENQLKESIQGMIYNFQKIRKCFHKHKIPFVGLRKLECTYNPRRNDFHPHFHILVDGKQAAERLISEWLQRYTQAKRISQDLRKADEGAILEMFKYFSKIVTNKVVYVAALDTIFQAMYKLRVYQPFGIRKVSEDIENIDSQVIKDLKTQETVWNWIENDWVDMNSGELLTGYTPDKLMKTITENIIS